MEPFKLSGIESALLSQNVYADFVSEYLRNTGVRAPLTQINEMERQAREHDPRYDSRVASSPIARFFVLPTRYSYDSLESYHSDASSGSALWAQGSDSSASRRGIMSNILRGRNPDAFTLKEATARSRLPQMGPTASETASKGLWSRWEGELLTLRDAKQVTKTSGDKLFADFKRFVERKYNAGEIALEGVVGERLDALEKALRDEGLLQAEEGLKNLRPQIGRNLLAEMDKHREFISDSLELTLLSRELPDRLLVYRAIVSDPQVEVARKLLTGGAAKLSPSTGTAAGLSIGTDQSQSKNPFTIVPEAPAKDAQEPEVGAVNDRSEMKTESFLS